MGADPYAKGTSTNIVGSVTFSDSARLSQFLSRNQLGRNLVDELGH